jgi:tetratricopeptide (TPR) repeat protein
VTKRAAVLHEAFALAEAGGHREVACKVCRELGYVATRAGRGVSAGRWLGRAGALAVGDREPAAVLGVRGKALSDRAHYQAAIDLLGESVAMARRCGDVRQAAWSLAILGRALLPRGQVREAVEVLDESLALVAEERWVAVQPFPEALRAEAALSQGDPERAIALLDNALCARVPHRRPVLGGDSPRRRGSCGPAGGWPSPTSSADAR